jgi:hypothetical protein
MAEPKTKSTSESVAKFLNTIADEKRREDCFRVLEIMKAETKTEAEMWGQNIVGFGRHQYKYESGTKGQWFLVGFAPRKQDLTLYIMSGLARYAGLLKDLGKHKTGKACLYIKKLDDINVAILKKLIKQSLADIAAMKK